MVRYASAARAIGDALGVQPAPECRIGQGRVTLTFRRLGGTRWSEDQRIDHAHQAAAIARSVLADDPRRAVRRRATRAVVVIYEDAALVRGCEIIARWECVITEAGQRDAYESRYR